jgi:hypothetical protein
MTLSELLLQREDALAKRWLDKTLATYHRDTAAFLARRQDQFANPVGHTLRTGTRAVLAALLRDQEPVELCRQLEPMIKVRSVQEFTPAQTISFVFHLKTTVREELAEELRDADLMRQLSRFDADVDQLALYAFDLFTKCRDQLHDLRVNEVKRRVSGLLRRMGIGFDDLEPTSDDRSEH